jgi:YVTN family beta-propeller protein
MRRPSIAFVVLVATVAAAAVPSLGATPRATPVPSVDRPLERVQRITGDISPKSVVASGYGLLIAQNMMYRHSVTVYGRDGTLVATVPDAVTIDGVEVRGAPVEAAWSRGGRYAYVSNYWMQGPGFDRPGDDVCSPAEGRDESYLFRLNTRTMTWDRTVRVGSVPKYVAVTPNGRHVLASNWCSWDLSIVNARTSTQVARVPLDRYPRGIAVAPDSSVAYVAMMGTRDIAVVDLAAAVAAAAVGGDGTGAVRRITGVGGGPRHLVLSPDGRTLYVTLNADGTVAALDLATEQVTGRVRTGRAPRSMAISRDGSALYVVNYESDTMSVVRTSDMSVVQEVATDDRPIGITTDVGTGDVWVSCYGGSLLVFRPA